MLSITVLAALLAASDGTQLDQNQAACAKAKSEREKLDSSFRDLLRRAQKDAGLTSRLKRAQQAWVKFKDSQLKALYGSRDPMVDYGSVFPMCSCAADEEMIKQRAAQVQRMLARVEGDACTWERP